MDYPPHLLDELARIFAKVALDRLLKDELETLPELQDDTKPADIPPPVDAAKKASAEGLVSDKSSD
jgi:hypothetical protein